MRSNVSSWKYLRAVQLASHSKIKSVANTSPAALRPSIARRAPWKGAFEHEPLPSERRARACDVKFHLYEPITASCSEQFCGSSLIRSGSNVGRFK